MTLPPDRPSLMDPEAAGGDHAEGGFRFQDHLILARIPEWLAIDGFSHMIREALGDTEARFFHPAIGELRELVEYKGHHLKPGEFWSEIDRFMRLDAGAPGAFRRFVLGCTSLSEQLSPLSNALRRVRGAFPFYEGAPAIRDASYADFVATAKKLDKTVAVADFLFERVLIEDGLPDAERMAREVFREALFARFPEFKEHSSSKIDAVRDELDHLVRSRKASPIARAELENVLWPPGSSRRPSTLRLHTGHRSRDGDPAPAGAIVLDWSAFSGEENRTFPSPAEWERGVVSQLKATRDWVIRSGRTGRLTLTGNRRLSPAVAIGAVFSAVHGFSIDMLHRGEVWSTSAHAVATTPEYEWEEQLSSSGRADDIVVAIGILRDATPDVDAYRVRAGIDGPRLRLFSASPIVSPEHTNRAVMNAKACISRALATTGARTIHLFIAGPAHFALNLGHRLNATARIKCYDWVSPSGPYAPTCELAT